MPPMQGGIFSIIRRDSVAEDLLIQYCNWLYKNSANRMIMVYNERNIITLKRGAEYVEQSI